MRASMVLLLAEQRRSTCGFRMLGRDACYQLGAHVEGGRKEDRKAAFVYLDAATSAVGFAPGYGDIAISMALSDEAAS